MNRISKQLIYEILIFFFFLFVSVMFFSPSLFTGKSYIYHDVEANFAPYQLLKQGLILDCKIHLWNPHVFSGTPYFANMSNGPTVFYPFSLLYYFFPIDRAIVHQFVIHFTLAGYFMYLFGRFGLKGDRIASVISGVSFAFCGFFVTHLIHTFIIAGSWLPLLFLFLKFGIEKKSHFFIITGGFTLSVLYLSGLVQVVYYICFALFFYWVWMVIDGIRNKSINNKDKVFIYISLPVMVLISIFVGAVQLLPFAEFFSFISRAGSHVDISNTFCMTWQRLITFFIPDFHGRPDIAEELQMFYPTEMKKYWFYWETCGYAGISVIFMSLIGLFYSDKKIKWFFLALFFLSITASMADNTPFYGLFKFFLPFYKSLRSHGRFLLLTTFSLTSMSVIGFNELKEKWKDMTKVVPVTGLFSLLFLVISAVTLTFSAASRIPFDPSCIIPDKRSGILICSFFVISITILLFLKIRNIINIKVFSCILLLLTVSDLFIFGFTFNRAKDCSDFFRKDISQQLKTYSPGDGRIVNLPLKDRNRGQIENFEAIQGYEPMVTGYYIKYLYYSQYGKLPDSEDLRSILYNSSSIAITDYVNNKMINLLNGKYIVFGDKGLDRGFYENINAFPRCAVFYNYRIFHGEDDEVLSLLNSSDFNIEEELLLDIEVDNFPPSPEKKEHFAKGKVIKYTPDFIEIEAENDKPALLFLSEIYYPGWKAKVDGRDEKIYKGDYMFRIVPLREKGKHVVTVYFDPLSYRIGSVISIVSIIFLVSYVVFKNRFPG